MFHLRLGAIHLGHSFEVDVEEGNRANGGTVAVLGQGATKVRGQLRKNLSKAGEGGSEAAIPREANNTLPCIEKFAWDLAHQPEEKT